MAGKLAGGHPHFITLEGGEGAGKSTQAQRIASYLERQGHSVCLTRQPGGTALAEDLRRMLKNSEQAIAPLTELLLLFAARAQFLEEVVRPALAAGQVVVCDRFTDSSYAYQGGGRGLPERDIATLEQLVHGDLQPGLTLLFDLDVRLGHERVASRGDTDRFEREDQAFFERVRQAYLARAAQHPSRFRIIQAGVDPELVWRQVETVLAQRLPGGSPP